jgi:hypothetical protein
MMTLNAAGGKEIADRPLSAVRPIRVCRRIM